MTTERERNALPDVQADSYRLALSFDSLFVNGIQFGVLRSAFSNGFLTKLGETLLKDLEALERDLPIVPADNQAKANVLFRDIHAEFVDFIDLLTRLTLFRSFSLQELHSAVSRIRAHRDEGVRLFEELEKCFLIRKPFYASRSKAASDAVDGFIADLPQRLESEWKLARSSESVPIA